MPTECYRNSCRLATFTGITSAREMTAAAEDLLRECRRSHWRLLLSPVVFGVASAFVHGQAGAMWSFIAVGLALTFLALWPLTVKSTLRSMRRHLAMAADYSDEALIRAYAGLAFMSAMPFKLAALMFFLAQMLESQWWFFANGVAFSLVAASRVPTRERAERWIKEVRAAAGIISEEFPMDEREPNSVIDNQVRGMQITVGT